jgi:hypothetical protein
MDLARSYPVLIEECDQLPANMKTVDRKASPTIISNLEHPFGAGPFGTSFLPKLGMAPRPPLPFACGFGDAVTASIAISKVKNVEYMFLAGCDFFESRKHLCCYHLLEIMMFNEKCFAANLASGRYYGKFDIRGS